ncbi:hypothetical protein ACIBAG_03145 [Streptomyces sp. NPDC051243]|uniref:hypothetical protein n=1 Tax=Streptomyces sp. NPDC051243 TaxID=3365646 RepID=UPI0037951EE5
MVCSTPRPPTIETGAAAIDGRQHFPTFSGPIFADPGFAGVRDDTDETPDCPWCAALRETDPPSGGRPSGPSGRRHDPYVSGAQYDDW